MRHALSDVERVHDAWLEQLKGATLLGSISRTDFRVRSAPIESMSFLRPDANPIALGHKFCAREI